MKQATRTPKAPGDGRWRLDPSLGARASRLYQSVSAPAVTEGFRRACNGHGLLLETIELRWSAGLAWVQPKPVGAPDGVTRLPPRAVFAIVQRTHRGLRRAIKDAERTWTRHAWRATFDGAAQTFERAGVRRLELAAVVCSTLDDTALAAHLDECLQEWRRCIEDAHALYPAFALPVGRFLAFVRERTGATQREMAPLFAVDLPGAFGGRALHRAWTALRQAGNVPSVDDAPARLDELCAAHPEVAAWWLRSATCIATAHDPAHHALEDYPRVALALLASANDARLRQGRAAALAQNTERRLRGRLGAGDRSRFDSLLAEARRCHDLRFERHLRLDGPMAGIVRRAALELGTRLTERGHFATPSQVFALEATRLRALARSGAAGGTLDVAGRVAANEPEAIEMAEVPLEIGGDALPSPPPHWFPAPVADLLRSVSAFVDGVLPDPRQTRRRRPGLALDGRRVALDALVGANVTAYAPSGTLGCIAPIFGSLEPASGGPLSISSLVAIASAAGSRSDTLDDATKATETRRSPRPDLR